MTAAATAATASPLDFLADRVIERSESEMSSSGGDAPEEDEVLREDSFHRRDLAVKLEIAEDDKPSALLSCPDSAVSLVSNASVPTHDDADAPQPPQIEKSTSALPQISVEEASPAKEDRDINQNDCGSGGETSSRSSTNSSSSLSSRATRLFQKRSYKSEAGLPNFSSSAAAECDSPGSKSVKSLSALHQKGDSSSSSGSKSWLMSSFGRKRSRTGSNSNTKKKSLGSLFDAVKSVTGDDKTKRKQHRYH